MTALAADFIFVQFMGNLIFAVLVTRNALGTILDFMLGLIGRAVPMHFTLFVTIHTHHALLVVDVGRSSVFTGELRINTPSMTRGAGFAFVFLYKLMALNQAGGNSGNGWRFDMATLNISAMTCSIFSMWCRA